METMAEVLLQRETVEGEAVNALLDGTWDEYLAKHPEKSADGAAAGDAPEADAASDADATPDAPAPDAPEQDPTERNTNDD